MDLLTSTPQWEGNLEARIVLITEAPSGTEMRLQRPMANAMGAGGVLDWALHHAFDWRKSEIRARRRQELLILNLWPWPVRKDKAKPPNIYSPDGELLCRQSKVLTPAGFEAAAECFYRLAEFEGTIIVPMGGPAFNAILGKTGVTKWRGSPLPFETYYYGWEFPEKPCNAQWIIPTIHPAHAIEREGGAYLNRYYLVTDLEKIKRFSEGHQPEGSATATLHINPTFEQAKEFSLHCRNSPVLNFDTEVSASRRHMTCYSLATDTSEAMCIPLLNANQQPYWSSSEEQELVSILAQAVEDPQVALCNQNLLFDLWILFMEWGILPRGPIIDSMCAFGILNVGLQKGLGTIGANLTDVIYYKDDNKAWVEKKLFDDWDNFQRYSARDSLIPLEACYGNSWQRGLMTELQEQGFQKTYDMTIRPFPILLEMMARGIAVDVNQLDIVAVAYQEHLKEKQAALDEEVGHPLNPNSSPQCMKYFYEELGLAPYVNDKGKPTVDKKALARLSRKPESMAAAQLISQLREERKLGSTYFDIDLDPDQRMRCSWNPRGTGFGRLSSSSTIYGTGMNMQNLPPRFRSFLVAG